jgi:hypothetical protein
VGWCGVGDVWCWWWELRGVCEEGEERRAGGGERVVVVERARKNKAGKALCVTNYSTNGGGHLFHEWSGRSSIPRYHDENFKGCVENLRRGR